MRNAILFLLLGATCAAIGARARVGAASAAVRAAPRETAAKAAATAALGVRAPSPALKPIYSNDFEKLSGDKFPDDMMILGGAFKIETEQGNKFLRLAGDPIENDGMLIGPENPAICSISARIRSSASGKRTPEFGVGLGGPGGHALWVVPAVNQIQLIRDDQTQATASFQWASGEWTNLRLQLRPTDANKWRIEARAWPQGKPEPADWQIAFDDSEKPSTGRAVLWGTPYSEKPIDFDDVVVSARP